MKKNDDKQFKCCICGKTFVGVWGNNPWPVDMHPDHKCCDDCNIKRVIPARIATLKK